MEEIRRSKKEECEKWRREKTKANPQLYEQTKAQESKNYKKQKDEKKVLFIGQVSERKQRK